MERQRSFNGRFEMAKFCTMSTYLMLKTSYLDICFNSYSVFFPLPGWFHLEQPVGAECSSEPSQHPESVRAGESQAAGSSLHPLGSRLWLGMSDNDSKRWGHVFIYLFFFYDLPLPKSKGNDFACVCLCTSQLQKYLRNHWMDLNGICRK